MLTWGGRSGMGEFRRQEDVVPRDLAAREMLPQHAAEDALRTVRMRAIEGAVACFPGQAQRMPGLLRQEALEVGGADPIAKRASEGHGGHTGTVGEFDLAERVVMHGGEGWVLLALTGGAASAGGAAGGGAGARVALGAGTTAGTAATTGACAEGAGRGDHGNESDLADELHVFPPWVHRA